MVESSRKASIITAPGCCTCSRVAEPPSWSRTWSTRILRRRPSNTSCEETVSSVKSEPGTSSFFTSGKRNPSPVFSSATLHRRGDGPHAEVHQRRRQHAEDEDRDRRGRE